MGLQILASPYYVHSKNFLGQQYNLINPVVWIFRATGFFLFPVIGNHGKLLVNFP